jgi:hypothetical protein
VSNYQSRKGDVSVKSIRNGALSFAILGAVIALALPGSLAHAQAGGKSEDAKKKDTGKFAFTIQGMKVGTCSFKLDATGASEATIEASLGGQEKKYVVKTSSKAGKLTGFSSEENADNRFTATIDGASAKVSINGGANSSHDVPVGVQPFGNFCPHLLSYTISAYDAKKGGAQPFNIAMVEGLPNGQIVTMKIKVTAKGSREIKVVSKPVTVKTYSLDIDANGTTIALNLFADADGRVLGWDVPSQSFSAVREGYEPAVATLKGPTQVN